MSSEQLADGVNPLDAELAATWDILKGYSGRNTDLGIARRFGGADAAYSLRDIGAMNGRVVEVRRDSDNAVEDFTANQVASGAVEAFVGGSNSGYVSTWYDQSGNGRDMIQPTTADQPRIVNSGTLETIDGKPTIKFLNVGTNLGSTFLKNTTNTPTANQVMSAYFVASTETQLINRQTFAGGVSDLALSSIEQLLFRRGGSNRSFNTLRFSVDENSIATYSNDSSFVPTCRLNGTSATDVAFTGTVGETVFQLLGENSTGASNDTFGLQGTMSEAILYNDIEYDASIESDIANYYNITLS